MWKSYVDVDADAGTSARVIRVSDKLMSYNPTLFDIGLCATPIRLIYYIIEMVSPRREVISTTIKSINGGD